MADVWLRSQARSRNDRARSMGTFLFLNHPPSHAFATAQGAGLRCVLKRTEKRADAKR
jgi:hypothetical protein